MNPSSKHTARFFQIHPWTIQNGTVSCWKGFSKKQKHRRKPGTATISLKQNWKPFSKFTAWVILKWRGSQKRQQGKSIQKISPNPTKWNSVFPNDHWDLPFPPLCWWLPVWSFSWWLQSLEPFFWEEFLSSVYTDESIRLGKIIRRKTLEFKWISSSGLF